jgi:uncharacterized protein (TIGR03435 family)
MKRLLTLIAAILLPAVVLGQPSTPVRFDADSVQVSTRPLPGMSGGLLRGTRYQVRNATMLDLVRLAYDVPAESIAGGPSWLEWDRYDIAALAPANTSQAILREMLKTLLAERFHLSIARTTTARQGFALRAASPKPTFKEAAGRGGCSGQLKAEPSGVLAMNMACRGVSMASLAEQLPKMAGQYFPDNQPVVNETGIAGDWDFDLKWTPIGLLPAAGNDGIPMRKAIENIGLLLEPRQIDVSAMAIERVDKRPTPDSPDVATRLPSLPPPVIEVASVKPSPPESQTTTVALQPNGQIRLVGVPLALLIRMAWDLPGNDFLVAPRWIQTSRFDITGRAESESLANAQPDAQMLQAMIQPLLIDRFRIKFHMEERPMSAYRLTADKPKMMKADPSKRTRCQRGLAGTGDRGVSQLASQYTCTNITMAQFGELLPQYARDYTGLPVRDSTELEGGWDFTLAFTPSGAVQMARAQPAAGAGAIDPTAALTLGEAINRQLGLKLQEEKRPFPVLVIDSIAEKPVED